MNTKHDLNIRACGLEITDPSKYFTELSPQPMVAVEGETHVVCYVNKAFEKLAGKDQKELIGRPFGEAVPEGEHNKCISLLDHVYRTGQSEALLEQKHTQKNGAHVYWSYWVWAVPGKDSRPAGLMIQVTDSSEMANFRQQVTQMNESLLVSSIKRSEELERTVEELRRSNDDLEKFAYVSSHDLKEPLRMVSMYVGLLADRYSDKLDEDARTFINYAKEGAVRINQMIKDILEYSRIGTRGRTFSPTDAGGVVAKALGNLELLIVETQAQVTVDSLPVVLADETQLTQVFQNLINNAIKFCKEDEPPIIHIAAEVKEGHWVFGVRDNGMGFDPQYQEVIFTAFRRLVSDRMKYPGSGIGLAIVKRIIERHGGKVWAESTPGQGTTFYFTLPIMEKK